MIAEEKRLWIKYIYSLLWTNFNNFVPLINIHKAIKASDNKSGTQAETEENIETIRGKQRNNC